MAKMTPESHRAGARTLEATGSGVHPPTPL
jgi:hypothetical protein